MSNPEPLEDLAALHAEHYRPWRFMVFSTPAWSVAKLGPVTIATYDYFGVRRIGWTWMGGRERVVWPLWKEQA